MNNNRGNNRRRGRGNNNNRQGGGQQLNRIDSRARGNAPQLLEKYRKLAHDAHLNGDRVTEEYYLQFADHYFRVLADQRNRQEEQRQRRDERWQEGGSDSDREDGDFASEYGADDYTAYDQPHRREREDRPQRQEERAERPERAERSERPERAERAPRAERASEPSDGEGSEDAAGEDASRSVYEPVENPFVREGRSTRGLKPRREGREERRPRRERAESEAEGAAPAFDASVLPPAISAGREETAEAEAPVAEEEAKPRRRTRKPKPPAGDAGETLETVS